MADLSHLSRTREYFPKSLPADTNIVATSIARGFGFTHQPYFGTAVFTGGGDEEGETLGLSEQHVEALMNLARLAQLQLA